MENSTEKEITTFEEYKRQFVTVFVGDYKSLFAKEAHKLIGLMLPVTDRMEAIEFLIEQFIKDTGKRPDHIMTRDSANKSISVLDLLASHILYEALEGDPRPDKMTLEEFPVVTATQTKRRLQKRGEVSCDIDAACKTIGTDNRNYRKPARRKLKPYEIDKREKAINENAKANDPIYKAATQSSKITRSAVA